MISLKPVTQETESSCGPAVIAMLLSSWNKEISQDQFVRAANIGDWIERHGTQPNHMIHAISRLAPDLQLWLKNEATLADLEYLVSEKRYPVAINWQGLFYSRPEEEPSYPSAEGGHYSVVVDIDTANDRITLLDPYPDFANTPRTFSLQWFVERWWDIGEQHELSSGKLTKFLTKRLLFIITPKNETFPLEISMSNSFSENL